MDARTVGQAGLYDGRTLVGATPQWLQNAVNDTHQVSIIFKGKINFLELSLALYKDCVGPVDHDLSD